MWHLVFKKDKIAPILEAEFSFHPGGKISTGSAFAEILNLQMNHNKVMACAGAMGNRPDNAKYRFWGLKRRNPKLLVPAPGGVLFFSGR
jgi:hypothetical protein